MSEDQKNGRVAQIADARQLERETEELRLENAQLRRLLKLLTVRRRRRRALRPRGSIVIPVQ